MTSGSGRRDSGLAGRAGPEPRIPSVPGRVTSCRSLSEWRRAPQLFLPLHRPWDEPRKNMGLDKISVFTLGTQLVSSGRARLAFPGPERGFCTQQNGWKPGLQTPGHKPWPREGSALFLGLRTGPYANLTRHEPSFPSLQLVLLEPVL